MRVPYNQDLANEDHSNSGKGRKSGRDVEWVNKKQPAGINGTKMEQT